MHGLEYVKLKLSIDPYFTLGSTLHLIHCLRIHSNSFYNFYWYSHSIELAGRYVNFWFRNAQHDFVYLLPPNWRLRAKISTCGLTNAAISNWVGLIDVVDIDPLQLAFSCCFCIVSMQWFGLLCLDNPCVTPVRFEVGKRNEHFIQRMIFFPLFTEMAIEWLPIAKCVAPPLHIKRTASARLSRTGSVVLFWVQFTLWEV